MAAELTFGEHVSLAGACFICDICVLCHIRQHVICQVMKQLIPTFVISRLDCCNGILAGLGTCLLGQLQRVRNAAARLVLGL